MSHHKDKLSELTLSTFNITEITSHKLSIAFDIGLLLYTFTILTILLFFSIYYLLYYFRSPVVTVVLRETFC